jgi:3,4-dihydroxy 2-butanone 4-phosphate synthase
MTTTSINTFTLESTTCKAASPPPSRPRAGIPVILLDDFDRENEADLIVAAEKLTNETMAVLIRECSGIVCLCLSADKVRALDLPPMAPENGSRYGTPFTVSIEAREGVTTGVSAQDRVTTIRAAIAPTPNPTTWCARATCFRCAPTRPAYWAARAIPKARSTWRSWPACSPPACCAS